MLQVFRPPGKEPSTHLLTTTLALVAVRALGEARLCGDIGSGPQ